MSDWVVTVTPTIMDGQVVRWFEPGSDGEYLPYRHEVVSASRNAVEVSARITDDDDRVEISELIALASEVMTGMRIGRDYRHLASVKDGGVKR